jgi:hypothetical protein
MVAYFTSSYELMVAASFDAAIMMVQQPALGNLMTVQWESRD